MHTKPCIVSLAFTACNWESRCNTSRPDIATKESFWCPKRECNKMNFYKCTIMSGFRKSGYKYTFNYIIWDIMKYLLSNTKQQQSFK